MNVTIIWVAREWPIIDFLRHSVDSFFFLLIIIADRLMYDKSLVFIILASIYPLCLGEGDKGKNENIVKAQ